MKITYRAEKGSPLTVEEMDNNFRILADDIRQLKNQDHTINIKQDKDLVYFVNNADQIIGEIILPKLIYRSVWTSTFQYYINDLVLYTDVMYRCIEDNIGSFDPRQWCCLTNTSTEHIIDTQKKEQLTKHHEELRPPPTSERRHSGKLSDIIQAQKSNKRDK